MDPKNLQNRNPLLGLPPTDLAGGTGIMTEYPGPANGSAGTFTDYPITLPNNYSYCDITLQAGGGKGGDVQKTIVTINSYWAGGGGSGSCIKVRLTKLRYPGGSTFTIRVGAGANTSNALTAGGNTFLYTTNPATPLATSIGGANGGDSKESLGINVNTGGAGYGVTDTAGILLDYTVGYNGFWSFSADSVNYAPAGFTGGGADSQFGRGYPMQSVFGATNRNGGNASGHGAGGEGALVVSSGAINSTKTGGNGSTGLAQVVVYY